MHPRPSPLPQASIKQRGRTHPRGFAIGMRIVAIRHQAIRQLAHARTEVGVQIQDAEYRQPGGRLERAQPREKLSFGIGDRLRGHGAVQHQKYCIHTSRQRRHGAVDKFTPEALEGRIGNRSAGRAERADRRHDLPPKMSRRLQKSVRGRAIALLRQDLSPAQHLHIFPSRDLRQEGMRFIEQRSEQNSGSHPTNRITQAPLRRRAFHTPPIARPQRPCAAASVAPSADPI